VRQPDQLLVALDWTDKPNMAVPCENVDFDGRNFSFEIPSWHAKYAAALGPSGESLNGFWNQGEKLPHDFVHQPNEAIELQACRKVPAIAPVPIDNLKPILDRELATLLSHGVLAKGTGGGVVIGILAHGKRRIFSYGTARPDSIFEIGSVTKTFTGLILAQMVEQKSVTLDEPVRQLMPPGVIPKSNSISLLDLATHHSGLPRLPDNLGDSSNAFATYDLIKLQNFFNAHDFSVEPKATFSYSNFGFGLLGYALARRAGCSYGQLIKTEVTGPLKLEDTVVDLSPEQKSRFIQGYNHALDPTDGGGWNHPLFEGAGSIKSTASDLLDYLNANLHPDTLPDDLPVGSPGATLPAAIALDHVLRGDAGQGSKVAMDWIYEEKSQSFGHGGGTRSYSSMVEFWPKRDRAIVVLYNRLDDTPGRERLVDRVTNNFDELMSGKPSRPIDCYSNSEGALVAAALQE
jgi:serine-type D-Ala-D-Ala carboxypeptidase/endopeptidase